MIYLNTVEDKSMSFDQLLHGIIFNHDLIDESDAELINQLNGYLRIMETSYLDFWSALALIDDAEQWFEQGWRPHIERIKTSQHYRSEPYFFRWPILAARAGGLAIRNFGIALREAMTTSKKIVSFGNKVSIKNLGIQHKTFLKTFPNFVALRDSIAHPESYPDPNYQTKFKGPIENIIECEPNLEVEISDTLYGRKFVATKNNVVATYELTSATLASLKNIADDFFLEFSPFDFRSTWGIQEHENTNDFVHRYRGPQATI